MPYDNPYNRAIADKMNDIDRRYAHLYAYSPVDGRGGYAGGGSSAGVLFQMGNASKREAEDNIVNDDLDLPPVYYYGNDAEMSGGSGFAEGSFRDRGDGHQLGVESATGFFDKSGGQGYSGGMSMMGGAVGTVNPFTGGQGYSGGMDGCGPSGGQGYSGGNLFSDLIDGFSDLGSDIGKAVEYVNPFGSGKPEHNKMKARLLGRMLGKVLKEHEKMKGSGDMSGGSWWDSLKEGVSDVVGLVPHLLLHGLGKKAGRPKKVGGAILGNPDPYPVQGNSERVAGRGRGRPKKGGAILGCGKEMVGEKQHDLLAMPSVVLANGIPPTAQLRGSYGGAKPRSKAEKSVMDAVSKKLGKGKITKAEKDALKSVVEKHGGKNLSGMTDKTGGMNLAGMTDKRDKMAGIEAKMGSGDGRKARAEIVKKIMRERGVKMIEASKIVKAEGLYKK